MTPEEIRWIMDSQFAIYETLQDILSVLLFMTILAQPLLALVR